MNGNLEELTYDELLAQALPKLTESEQQRLVTAYRKIMTIDTFSNSPLGSHRTNYQGEARAEFAKLLPELQRDYPDDPVIQFVVKEFASDKG